MKIKKVAIGNDFEAFIENRFKDGFNIISSDDNNKGKTLIIQSMMYSLGNEPVFPSSFNFEEYYHYVEVNNKNDENFKILRKKRSFVVLHDDTMKVFDNLSEFKIFIDDNLFKLPKIIKDNYIKMVDPFLFYQLFFVGQDGRDTSNIISKGYYNKNDFLSMVFSYKGINSIIANEESEKELKEKLKKLKRRKKEFEKSNKIFTQDIPAVEMLSIANNQNKFDKKLKEIDKIKNQISNLSKQRNKVVLRKIKNETTLKELRSLNRSLDVGSLHCLDCNSKNIGYSTADKSYTFEISNTNIRNQILESIEKKVSAYSDEISKLNYDLNTLQDKLNFVLEDEEVSIESLLLYKSTIKDLKPLDDKISKINFEIAEITNSLSGIHSKSESDKTNQRNLLNDIISSMTVFYNKLDPYGNLTFEELFSKKYSVYSGCESTEFYLSKIFALKEILKHDFPIIIDNFRAGELSSLKEKIVLDNFKKFSNQIIFTVTLKDEETGKYEKFPSINNINYFENTPSKLLSDKHLSTFKEILKMFSFND